MNTHRRFTVNRIHLVLGALVLLIVLWGGSQISRASRARQLEERVARLEDDLRAITTNRDALKVRLAALEEQVRAESDRARLIAQERDALTAQLRLKATEKAAVVAQYDDLVKQLEAVLGQARVAQMQHAEPGKVHATVTSLTK